MAGWWTSDELRRRYKPLGRLETFVARVYFVGLAVWIVKTFVDQPLMAAHSFAMVAFCVRAWYVRVDLAQRMLDAGEDCPAGWARPLPPLSQILVYRLKGTP